jgi:DNA-binding NarL/FixJ family response regulator
MQFKIALAEDNAVNRNTFLQKIRMSGKMDLLFVANNGNECLEQLKSLPQKNFPEVIFMDLEMPELDGIETIRIAKTLYPQVQFIVLTVFDDDIKLFEAIRAGASGYILKHEPAAVLEAAVVEVLQTGGAPMSPAIARKALQLLSRSGDTPEGARTGNEMPGNITDREKQILQHMVSGWDAKRIATTLDVSVLTVRKHIANIYDKLHVNSRAQVISLAHKNKWLRE